jgi:hypothetical protein
MISLAMMLAAASGPALALTPADARLLTKRCRVPEAWVKVLPAKQVRFTPPPDAPLRKTGCVLHALQRYDVTLEMIGNQAPG